MQIGIVGLPFSGKSTLFQTITKTHLDPSVLTKAEAHHAIVKVPDARLEKCSELFSPRSTVHATIEFVDVVGLKKGESGSTQFTTNFLSNVKTNDALVQVIRLFENHTVPHPDGTLDAARDIASFETEFILSDMTIIEMRIERIKKQLQKIQDENVKKELPVLEKCRKILETEKPLREVDFTKEEAHILKTYQLLSIKPILIALNFDESQLTVADTVKHVAGKKEGKNTKVVSFFGKIEMEMSELPDDEARVFMNEYGIKESALDTLIREAYALLGLQSFFTVGEDECRAWTIKKGMTAQEAAGVIHSDFVNKFIRAEVVHYNDFIASGGSFAKAKEVGHWRLEGKEYIVNDGDIMEIRHS
ncbi:MAG: redox-regulated ATPase YchF [Ignavibacteriae bacterium]|nr:redox-regulated ATPase YchF [Ignavibacteria bacterium]MBI3364557.1 redox-regulated ATPase YchF [Ignavibacteriota bacterium]